MPTTDPDKDPITAIEEHCKTIALTFMKIHPAVGRLTDPELQATCLQSLHAMTTELEVIKKHLIMAQHRDDSTAL